jgi:Arc/MetJ-type ribon-helix-helix transcriptional regulator
LRPKTRTAPLPLQIPDRRGGDWKVTRGPLEPTGQIAVRPSTRVPPAIAGFDKITRVRYTPRMTINLPMTPQLEQLLREQLASGRFQTASEAVSAALRLLEEHSPASDAAPDHAFGLWKGRVQDGLAYQHAIRAEWGR